MLVSGTLMAVCSSVEHSSWAIKNKQGGRVGGPAVRGVSLRGEGWKGWQRDV